MSNNDTSPSGKIKDSYEDGVIVKADESSSGDINKVVFTEMPEDQQNELIGNLLKNAQEIQSRFEILNAEFIKLQPQIENVKNLLSKTERKAESTDKIMNYLLIGFFALVVTIVLDYLIFNFQRYENIMNSVSEMQVKWNEKISKLESDIEWMNLSVDKDSAHENTVQNFMYFGAGYPLRYQAQ